MIKKMLKKIFIICALTTLALICFGAVNKSDASEVVETWDVSAEDGKSHIIATLYSNGKLVLDGTGKCNIILIIITSKYHTIGRNG